MFHPFAAGLQFFSFSLIYSCEGAKAIFCGDNLTPLNKLFPLDFHEAFFCVS